MTDAEPEPWSDEDLERLHPACELFEDMIRAEAIARDLAAEEGESDHKLYRDLYVDAEACALLDRLEAEPAEPDTLQARWLAAWTGLPVALTTRYVEAIRTYWEDQNRIGEEIEREDRDEQAEIDADRGRKLVCEWHRFEGWESAVCGPYTLTVTPMGKGAKRLFWWDVAEEKQERMVYGMTRGELGIVSSGDAGTMLKAKRAAERKALRLIERKPGEIPF